MKTKNRFHQSGNTLQWLLLVIAVFCLFLVVGVLPSARAQESPYFTVHTLTLKDGTSLDDDFINGPSVPPPGYDIQRATVSLPESVIASGSASLNVPAYAWFFGCSATSGSMIAGYYDREGFPNLYTGPTNGGVMPLDGSSWPAWKDVNGDTYAQNPLTASHQGLDGSTERGSINDYWVYYLSGAQDPYVSNNWTQHTWGSAIGDYMKTSQFAYGNDDGSTQFYNYTSSASPLTCSAMKAVEVSQNDGTYGRKLFYEAKGYTVTDCYNQKTDNIIAGGFSFTQYKAEINAGRPVMLNLKGHTIVGFGYNDSTSTVYIHDTWDYFPHSMTWGGSYVGMQLQSVSIVNLSAPRTISGNAGVAGVSLSYTDGTPKTASSDGSGYYSFPVSYNWSGTVTPTKPGYTFSPASLSYTNVVADQIDQNYTATPITYTISGNAGIGGVILGYTDGSPKTTTADGSGDYSFSVSFNWYGTTTPSLTGYTFSPVNRTYTNVLADQGSQDYIAFALLHISGNAGVAGAILTYTGGSTMADGSGNYTINNVHGWSGKVTPSKAGYVFSPPNRIYINLLEDQSGQNYTPSPAITISGYAGDAGVTLTFVINGMTQTIISDKKGNYSLSVPQGWSGQVVPSIQCGGGRNSLARCYFIPLMKSYTNVQTNQRGQNYILKRVY